MVVKFVVVCVVTLIFLLPKNAHSKQASVTKKCILKVQNLYEQIITQMEKNNPYNSSSYDNNCKKFVPKLEALQNDTNKLNTLSIFEKLASIYRVNKPNVNFLEKKRLVLHSKLKSNEDNLNILDTLITEAQEKLLNATELENIINIHDKELEIISKEAQHILNEVENLVVLIISINDTCDATQSTVKNLHNNKTEVLNLLKNVTDGYLNLTQKINATENKNNETILEIIKLHKEIDELQIPELPKIDKCDSFEAELVDMVNNQSKFLNVIEKTTNNVTQLQKTIKETHNNLTAYERRADLAIKEINETLSVIADFKNGFSNTTSDVTDEIEKKLAEIADEIENLIKKVGSANATLKTVSDDIDYLANQTDIFDTLTENVTNEYLNLSDELDELNVNLVAVDFSPNEIKMEETKILIGDLEEKYLQFEETFRGFLQQHDDLYKKRKSELKEITDILRDNENSLQILKEYVAILDHFDFSDEKLEELEEEIKNAEELQEMIKEKERLEKEVEIVKKIYEGLPPVGKKYCKTIEIEPIAET